MSPILGIWASSQQPALNATSFDSIATVTVGAGGSSSITFSSIPNTYTHLQIRGIGAMTSGGMDECRGQFNSDTATNYSRHYLYGDGSVAGTGAQTSTNNFLVGVNMLSSNSNTFGTVVLDILDYTNTNKYKTTRSLSGVDQNGTGYVSLVSGNWRSTSAITSITLFPISSTFPQYTKFALYGVKG